MVHFNLILGFSLLVFSLTAQEKKIFSPSISLTTSVTFEPESFFRNTIPYLYVETHGILKLHTKIGKNFSTGIYISTISNYSKFRGWQYHIMGGLELSYLFNITKSIIIKPTFGTYLGNFCTCRNRLSTGELAPPIKQSSSFYLGGGGDIAFKFKKSKNLYFVLGLHSFSYTKERNNFTQPQLGLWWLPK